jgi:hypothetical protein
MEFKITEEEARAMARFEEEVGCDISAGPDYGIHLGKVMSLALHQVDHEKFVEFLEHYLGSLLSSEEVVELAFKCHSVIHEHLIEKMTTQKSA